MSDEALDFDSFFVDDADEGAVEPVTVRGKTFTVTVKRGLSLGDRLSAQAVATKSHVSPAGQLVIDSFDPNVNTMEIMARALKGWTLPRPCTRENILALQNDVADAIAVVVQKYVAPSQEALAPFAPQSDAA